MGTRGTSQAPALASPSLPPSPPPLPTVETRRTSSRIIPKTLTPIQREKARVEAVKDIVTVEEAIAKLVSRQFSVPDQEHTSTHLASVLFQLSATLPAEGASIVKAVAILVNQINLDNHADRMASALMDTLTDPLEGFITMGAAIQTHADRVIDGHESIENCVIEMVARVGNLHDAFRETQEKAEANTTAVQAMIASLEKRISTQDPPPPPPSPPRTLMLPAHACNSLSYTTR